MKGVYKGFEGPNKNGFYTAIIEGQGLPTRFYVKKGTKAGRVLDNAKSYSRGDPEETYTVRGLAKDNRQLIVEEAEKN